MWERQEFAKIAQHFSKELPKITDEKVQREMLATIFDAAKYAATIPRPFTRTQKLAKANKVPFPKIPEKAINDNTQKLQLRLLQTIKSLEKGKGLPPDLEKASEITIKTLSTLIRWLETTKVVEKTLKKTGILLQLNVIEALTAEF